MTNIDNIKNHSEALSLHEDYNNKKEKITKDSSCFCIVELLYIIESMLRINNSEEIFKDKLEEIKSKGAYLKKLYLNQK